MSLINDALKRAKQAQQEAPPPPPSNTDLRPVEQRQYGRPSVGLAVPVLLGIASLVLLFLLWQTARNSNLQTTLEVNARTKTPAPAPAQTSAEPAPRVPTTQPVSPAPAPSAAVAASTAHDPTAQVSSNALPVAATAIVEPSTNPVPVLAVTPPKPALPKLQAIIYNPNRPSVMIGGKSLFIGDRLGEFRVRAIDQETVTLVSASQTNVLTLPE